MRGRSPLYNSVRFDKAARFDGLSEDELVNGIEAFRRELECRIITHEKHIDRLKRLLGGVASNGDDVLHAQKVRRLNLLPENLAVYSASTTLRHRRDALRKAKPADRKRLEREVRDAQQKLHNARLMLVERKNSAQVRLRQAHAPMAAETRERLSKSHKGRADARKGKRAA